MRRSLLLFVLVALVTAVSAATPVHAQETPASMVSGYDALATSILGLRHAETAFVRTILEYHLHAAKAAYKAGEYGDAAAQMALFANEGDNAVAGIRKRLLEGGHHHHSQAEEDAGIYEPGYVIVTRAAKEKMLAASSALRQAGDDAAREAAWKDFATTAKGLLTE